MPPRKIVSGGQTGIDRGALEAAIALGLEHGGWCPRGRRAEDGPIPACYNLVETSSDDYSERTERNVLDSDATLIVCRGPLAGGTGLTQRLAAQHGKPCLVVDLGADYQVDDVRAWCQRHEVGVLNVAGPRESLSPGIGEQARALVTKLLRTR
jgi:hypothetical protein